MAKKEDHAKHNAELCRIIRAANKHHDWVVTTAFYSALHYVDLKIFPFNVTGIPICNDIKTAKSVLRMPSKHETRLEMVNQQCNEIYDAYRWLYDNAGDSRYKTYKFTATQAQKALEQLEKIERYCATPVIVATNTPPVPPTEGVGISSQDLQ